MEVDNRHYPDSVKIIKGCLNQTWQNIRFVKSFPTATKEALEARQGKKKQEVYIKVFEIQGIVYTNQIG